jgi:large subunit ribosomal protein L5
MIRMRSWLTVADNSGAKQLTMILPLGGDTGLRAGLGDVITASVKEAAPDSAVKAGTVVRAVVVRTRKEHRRRDGTYIRFDDNAAVLINEAKEPVGTRVFGPVARELREKNFAKIVVNIGMGEASQNVKLLDVAVIELGQIAGQKPVVTRAKKSIANFKIRKGMPIGCCVTLRGDRMYEFLDRLCNIVLPRVRDFKGLPPNAFDGRGNYTIGLKDQLVFPEIDYTRVDKIKGMNITFTTTARSDEEGRELLRGLGVPLRAA